MTFDNWLHSLLNAPAAFFVAVVFMLSCCCIGNVIMRGLKFNDSPSRIALEPVVGVNASFLIFFILANFHIINSYVVWSLLVMGSIGFIFLCGKNYFNYFRSIGKRHKVFFIFSAIFFLFYLSPALCPPIWWDDLTYHLVLPLRWLQDGFPAVYRDLPYSGYPSAPEMIFYGLTAAGGIMAPALVVWLMFFPMTTLLYICLNRVCGRISSLIFCMLFMLSPAMAMILKGAYIEVFMLAGTATAILLVFPTFDDSEKLQESVKVTFLLGLILGGLCVIKLNGVLIAAVFLVMYFFNTDKEKRLKNSLTVAVVIMIFALPFYLRPLLTAGNPFYPYFGSLFSTDPAVRLCSHYHHASAAAKYGIHNVWGLIAGPVLACLKGQVYDGFLGFQFIPVIIAAVVTPVAFKKNRHYLRMFLSASLVIYIGWFFSAQQVRFLLPATILLMLPAAHFFGKLKFQFKFMAMSTLLFLTIASVSSASFKNNINCWFYLLSKKVDLKSFIYSGTGLGYLPAAEMIDRLTPKDSEILMIFDNRSLYIPRKTRLGTPLFQDKYLTPLPINDRALVEELRKKRITHLLIGMSRHNPDRQQWFQDNRDKLLPMLEHLSASNEIDLLWRSDNFYLFRINDPGNNLKKTPK